MDYIQNQMLEGIRLTKDRVDGQPADIAEDYKNLMQYRLSLMFACVWDKREPELSRTNPQKRMDYLDKMQRAEFGKILTVIMELDREGTPILGVDQKFEAQMRQCIELRNDNAHNGVRLGKELVAAYERIDMSLQKMKIPILSEDEECRIYYMRDDIISTQPIVFRKESYGYQDLTEELVRKLGLQAGELYYYFNDTFYKISPFLILRKKEDGGKDPYEICYFSKYDLDNGTFQYVKYPNQGVKDASCKEDNKKDNSDYFRSLQEEFPHTIRKVNGMICNKFKNNYDHFILPKQIEAYEQKVWNFIKTDKSNACLTIRGGGGIGKTALIQFVCAKNLFKFSSVDNIQYVIFCSAKDREFTQSAGLAGHIHMIQDEGVVRCYEDIIRTISWVLGVEADPNTEDGVREVEEALVMTSGVLLIVDDFETLSGNDKNKVVALSSKLDASKHKLIITTRSQYVVGEEYYIESLNHERTIDFMKEHFHEICDSQGCNRAQQERFKKLYKEFETFIKDKEVKKTIYELTKGLPMLAIQLENILVVEGFKKTSLRKREDEETEDFLLGRLYHYFATQTTKILFLIIANFYQDGDETIELLDLQNVYTLVSERLGIANVDFKQDLNELNKLNIIKVEADHIKISNYISNKILRQCQDELLESEDIDANLFDIALFNTLAGRKDIPIAEEDAPVDDYLQEIITEFEQQEDAIDEFLLARKNGASQTYCLDTIQAIRGKLGSICNVKLAKAFSFDLGNSQLKLREIKDLMDEISYTKEFSMKDNKQYQRLESLCCG